MADNSQSDAMKEKTPILEVSNLHVNRSNSSVIEHASFTIHRGDYVGIVGPNGGGKTSLLLALLNIMPRTIIINIIVHPGMWYARTCQYQITIAKLADIVSYKSNSVPTKD